MFNLIAIFFFNKICKQKVKYIEMEVVTKKHKKRYPNKL